MDNNLMEIGIYILGGALIVLLIMYLVKTRIDNQFRKKVIPLLKKQKKTIDALEKERDQLSQRSTELKRDLNIQKNQAALQDTEYEKINFIFTKGLLERIKERTSDKTKNNNESKEEDLLFIQQVEAAATWFQYKYLKNPPDPEEMEVTETLNKLADSLNSIFTQKKLNFVCHLGEPVQVQVKKEVLNFIVLTFGRLIGDRSVLGNTLYFDTDRTGKKCLISLEDSGPGDNDQAIKSLFSNSWTPNRLPEMEYRNLIPVLIAKDLITIFQGNAWYSRVHEIGIKITFSVPLKV